MSAGLAAELCYADAVRLRPADALAAIRRHWPTAELADGTTRGGGYMVAFPELTAYDPGGSAIRLLVAFGRAAGQPADAGDRRDLGQTWDWDDAAKVMATATHTVTATEVFGTWFAPADRARAFTAVVRGVGDATGPVGVWWPASTLATPPEALAGRPLAGVVNVRRHDVTGRFLMDTLGLAPLGLPDLQCVCGALPPESVAARLTAAAEALVAGWLPRTGDTVPGLTPHQRWQIGAGPALAGPSRPVLTLRP